MNKSESIKELSAALAKAQGIMGAARMDSTNPFLKNKYADLGSVIQAARPALSVNGLCFTQHPAVTESSVTVTTMLMHASGEWIESEITLPLGESRGLSLAQSMGAIITYLRRYTLSAILGIYADEDTDGNDGKTVAKAAPAPLAKPAAPTAPRPESVVMQELGYPPESKGPSIDPTQDAPGMTLEEALNMTDSKHKRYGDNIQSLPFMASKISDKLAAGLVNEADIPLYNRKLAAIKLILANQK